MHGGEIFIPKIPSVKITDLAQALSKKTPIDFIGIRPGEKLHELMVAEDDAHLTLEFKDHFVIKPSISFESKTNNFSTNRCSEQSVPVRSEFSYSSINNPEYLSVNDLKNNPCFLGEDNIADIESTFISELKQNKETKKVQAIA